MSRRKVDRKNLRVVSSNAAQPSETKAAQQSASNDAAIAVAFFFWPIDVMRWWMPRSVGRAEG